MQEVNSERFEPNTVLWTFHTIQPSSFSFLRYSFCFCFGSVLQIKLSIRQLLVARKYSLSYRIVS